MENSQNTGGSKDLKQAYRTGYLIAGFLKQTLTEEEAEELDTWILASDENMILFEKMTDERNIKQATEWFRKMNVEAGLAETKKKITRPSRRFRPYAVAASVIVIITASVLIFNNTENRRNTITVSLRKQDIMPGTEKATLTLSDGKVIELGNSAKDTAIDNGRIKISGKSGQISYSPPAISSKNVLFNTLNVPRKGTYKLILSDGSIVWLNSESSVRYPVDFKGNERRVYVTGETFFEVAKDKNKPFRVVSGDMTVEALGTQFNVNAYQNEPFASATLVEGSVIVSKGADKIILKPSQQAMVTATDLKMTGADVEEVMAWKNNQFKFINTSIAAIMRQVERWYDADVLYKDTINLHLNATIERGVPVSKLLRIFEQTNQVHFKIENNKIIVME